MCRVLVKICAEKLSARFLCLLWNANSMAGVVWISGFGFRV
jgi:hypothetical protein